MTLLLLGGTLDARRCLAGLEAAGITQSHRVIYSVAGKVRVPNLACEVITGGFRQKGGLTQYLAQQQVDLILDMTHPFAETMSHTAVTASKAVGIPCWRFERPAWVAGPKDRWQWFDQRMDMFQAAEDYRSVLLSVGQLTADELALCDHFNRQSGQQQLLRTAVASEHTLPAGMSWLQAIGPFELAMESALLREHGVDLILSKDSGGEATQAKLIAARDLGIPVFLLRRPTLLAAEKTFQQTEACVHAVCAWAKGQE